MSAEGWVKTLTDRELSGHMVTIAKELGERPLSPGPQLSVEEKRSVLSEARNRFRVTDPDGYPISLTAAAAVAMIESGAMDAWIEAILNAAHNRKRTLRQVRGFDGR